MRNVTTHSTTRASRCGRRHRRRSHGRTRDGRSQGPTGPPGGCADTTNVIVGGPGNDVILGTPQNDLILGGGGDDRINGRGGHDTIHGGDGNDTVLGAKGNDCVAGDAGKDKVNGNHGRDNVSGGTGADHVGGGPGADNVNGGPGVRHPHDLPGRGQHRERRELNKAAVSRGNYPGGRRLMYHRPRGALLYCHEDVWLVDGLLGCSSSRPRGTARPRAPRRTSSKEGPGAPPRRLLDIGTGSRAPSALLLWRTCTRSPPMSARRS